jgi:polygalacturonase
MTLLIGGRARAKSLEPETGRPLVNVKDFGATGDGITDDSLALKMASDYLDRVGGGTIYCPKGTYRLEKYRFPFSNMAWFQGETKGIRIP